MKNAFISTVHKFVVRESIGATAMRNQGVGVLHAVHAYLDQLKLADIQAKDKTVYLGWLDQHTETLVKELPVKHKLWGAARKALNLFMRTALYNRYLSGQFKLDSIEKWMEIPLDSAVAGGLKKQSLRGQLPQWPGLRKLTPKVSEQFQAVAQTIADQQGLSKVHLDMYLWMENR